MASKGKNLDKKATVQDFLTVQKQPYCQIGTVKDLLTVQNESMGI